MAAYLVVLLSPFMKRFIIFIIDVSKSLMRTEDKIYLRLSVAYSKKPTNLLAHCYFLDSAQLFQNFEQVFSVSRTTNKVEQSTHLFREVNENFLVVFQQIHHIRQQFSTELFRVKSSCNQRQVLY